MIATPNLARIKLGDAEIQSRNIERRNMVAAGLYFQRAGTIDKTSSNDERRSVDAVIATERPVPIYDRGSGKMMNEVLLMRGAVLPPWVPLLESHQTWSLMHVLGSVVGTTRSGRVARGRFEFAREDEHVDPIWRRVRDGHIRGVSVGGRRLSWVDIQPGESAEVAGRRWTAGRELGLRITTQWLMREASVVIFGADEDAQFS